MVDFFKREKIDYALIGAFALKAYGYMRATADIDFIVRQKDQAKIIAHLESLGFETVYSSSGYSNHVHPLSGSGRIDFVYVKGDTAESIFNETKRLLVLGNIAMKNDPDRALKEMADIKELLNLPGIDLQEVRKYFEKYGQMERYYDIIGEKRKK